jgi:hypothetical protein
MGLCGQYPINSRSLAGKVRCEASAWSYTKEVVGLARRGQNSDKHASVTSFAVIVRQEWRAAIAAGLVAYVKYMLGELRVFDSWVRCSIRESDKASGV